MTKILNEAYERSPDFLPVRKREDMFSIKNPSGEEFHGIEAFARPIHPPAGAAESITSQMTSFLPSTHGFHFDNRFDPTPTYLNTLFGPIKIGDASKGLCGGRGPLVLSPESYNWVKDLGIKDDEIFSLKAVNAPVNFH